MNKKLLAGILTAIMVISLTGCTNKTLEAANQAVSAYNIEAQSYNDKVDAYNSKIVEVENANASLTDATNKAQEVINKGDTPYDEQTLTDLKNAMATAGDAKVSVPDKLEVVEEMSVNEDAKKDELEALSTKANEDAEKLKAFAFPDTPDVPDFTNEIKGVETALTNYENSIQSMKQITAPSDDFVMERLQRIDTITMMAPVTEDHDPNGKLGKQGGYIGCIYFRDSQVDQSTLYVDGDREDVVDVGTQGGGAIEIFNTNEEATARDLYLANFDGTMFASGSHYVIGTVLIRTSDELTGTQQLELTDKIKEVLTSID